MTAKEADNILLTEVAECSDCGRKGTKIRKCALYGCKYGEALLTACKSLTAWGKVKEKIAKLRDSWEKDCYHDEADALSTALRIIDEYLNEVTE